MTKIYLSSPYTHPKAAVRLARHAKACKATGILIERGHLAFSPIAHSHPIAEVHDLPHDYHFWQRLNHSWLDWADALIILTLDGWRESKGVQGEITYATTKGLPIIHWYPGEDAPDVKL